jgi:hypothetical protein
MRPRGAHCSMSGRLRSLSRYLGAIAAPHSPGRPSRDFPARQRVNSSLLFRQPFSVLLLLAALSAVGAGCGGDGDNGKPERSAPQGVSPGTYVGTGPGDRPAIGLVVENDRARAYLCDGRSLNLWFPAKALDEEAASLRSEDGKARIEGSFAGGSFSGTATLPDGDRFEFSARRAESPLGIYTFHVDRSGELRGRSIVGGPRFEAKVARRSVSGKQVYVTELRFGGLTLDQFFTGKVRPVGDARLIVFSTRGAYGAVTGENSVSSTGASTGDPRRTTNFIAREVEN